MPNEEPVLFPMQVGSGDLRDRLLRAISGTGSWVRLMGYFGIAPLRSLSSVLSVQCPEVTQKDHVRPEKLRLPAIESRFQV
jgi:hypothetical protein